MKMKTKYSQPTYNAIICTLLYENRIKQNPEIKYKSVSFDLYNKIKFYRYKMQDKWV